MQRRKASPGRWILTLVTLLAATTLACGLGGSKKPSSNPGPTATWTATPAPPEAIPRRESTPRPVATFPVYTPTPAPSPTAPPGTEGASWIIAALIGAGGNYNDLAFSPDGNILAVAARDGMVRLLDPVNGFVVRTLVGHSAQVNRVRFGPDGAWLVSAADDGTVMRWDTLSGVRSAVMGDSSLGKVTALAVSPAGDLIASSSGVGAMNLWSGSTGGLAFKVINHLSSISGLSFSPLGTEIASSDVRGIVIISPADGREGEEFARDPEPVRDLVYTRDGRLVAATRTGVWVWDTASKSAVVLEPVSAVGSASRLAVSQDGELLAALSDSGTTWVWELSRYQLRAAIPPGEGDPLSLAFSPVCQACPTQPSWMLAIGGANGRLWLWGIQPI